MLARPQFKDHFRVEVVEPDQVYLLSETQTFVLKGRLYARLAPLIDGRRTSDEIAGLLKGAAALSTIYYALLQLEKKGYTRAADNEVGLTPEAAAFWQLLGVEPATVAARLRESEVLLLQFGGPEPAPDFPAVLQTLGLQVTTSEAAAPSAAHLWVAVCEDFLQADLARLNQKALAAGQPWLLVKPSGLIPAIGPLFVPGQTGCWECLAQRVRLKREVQSYLADKNGPPFPPLPTASLLSTRQAVLNLAATEIARWVVNHENTRLEGAVLTLDLAAAEMAKHSLVKRPQCPACGQTRPEVNDFPAPPDLKSRPKTLQTAGSFRTVLPQTTLRRFQHHISPVTGLVGRLERISGDLELPIHVYMAGHNLALQYDSLFFLRQGLRSKSSGKGTSDLQARAGALCESLERFSGVFQGDEPRRTATYRELGAAAIQPNDYLLFSPDQYRQRQDWNRRNPGFHYVPLPFEETTPLEWTPLWSLTEGRFKFLPTACCYYGYPPAANPFLYQADSNGCAAGNTLEEAILQGFLELIERDSVAVWWYNRATRPGVDLASFQDPFIAELQNYYRTLNRELWILDITADLGIPTFAAISRRIDRPQEYIILAFGSHFEARQAILRALTELNQMVVNLPPDDFSRETLLQIDNAYRTVYDWWQTATLANQPYLRPDGHKPLKQATDYVYVDSADLLENIEKCQRLVEAQGMEMLVLDQTRPDIGLNVVRVVVPGLRHFWARYGCGRLYQVPVKLGWQPEILDEAALNPVPMFI